MSRIARFAWGLWLLNAGCTQHLLFVEESHFGLRAKFAANSPSPYDVDLGYRRGLFVLIPKQDTSSESTPADVVKTEGDGTVVVTHDPDELMSLFSIFRANIGLNDPILVEHFVATGIAASQVAASKTDIASISKRFAPQGEVKK